jgi:hypothetical protein
MWFGKAQARKMDKRKRIMMKYTVLLLLVRLRIHQQQGERAQKYRQRPRKEDSALSRSVSARMENYKWTFKMNLPPQSKQLVATTRTAKKLRTRG